MQGEQPLASEAEASSVGWRRAALWLLPLMVFGGGLRLVVMERSFPIGLIGDESHYVDTATHIAAGMGHVSYPRRARAATPPLHPFLLSFFVDLANPPLDPKAGPVRRGSLHIRPDRVKALLRWQVALGTLLVGLTALLAWSLFDERTGILAGLVAAAYPPLVAYSHFLFAATLFTCLLVGALIGVVRGMRLHSLPLTAATGMLFGIAGLTREAAIPIAGCCAFWWLWVAPPERRQRALVHGAVLLACMVLVIAPWTYRNYRLFQRLVPTSTIGWMGLREGNTFDGESWLRPDAKALRAFRRDYFAIPDEMERMDVARREALASIRAEQPTWIFKKLARNVPLLFGPDSVLFEKIGKGAYGELSLALVRCLLLFTALSYSLVLLFGVLGIAMATGRGRRMLPCLVIGATAVLHVVANASSRYRLPLMPLLIVYASYALVHLRSCRRALTGRRAVVPAVVALLYLTVCVPYTFPEASRLWSEGVHAKHPHR